MDFRLTSDQTELRDAVRDYLAGEHGPETLRRLDVEGARDPELRQGLVEMGLTGLLVPKAQGGLGLGLVEAALIATELGRANVSELLADTALVAVPLLAHSGGHETLLEGIVAGKVRVALQHLANPWVADHDSATHLIATGAKGLLFGPTGEGGSLLESVDPLRRLSKPTLAAGKALAASSAALLDLAALSSAAQLLGGAERMLDLAVDYAKTREQFGQAIGGFQAVKHHLASVAVKIEFARPAVLRAAWSTEHAHERAPVHISHAKVAATDAAILSAETAIQIHGAMGYTYEVDLHFWMKRAWALAGAWGDRAFHQSRLEAAVLDGGMAIGPETTFASELHHG